MFGLIEVGLKYGELDKGLAFQDFVMENWIKDIGLSFIYELNCDSKVSFEWILPCCTHYYFYTSNHFR